MQKIILNATKREIIGKKVQKLRESGFIPAVLYGADSKPVNLCVLKGEFDKVYSQAGTSALVDLKIENSETKVLIHEPQLDPVKDIAIHIDFYKVKMTEKITTEIPLEFIGESPAVKDMEGNLITNKDEVEVECLPGDLISEIQVDISILKTFEDSIHVKDLQIPSTVEILDDPEEIVAQVTPPRSEEELEAMEQETAVDQEKAQIEQMESTSEAEKAQKEAEKEGGDADAEIPKKEVPAKDEKK